MANHKSAQKRVRQIAVRRLRNRYQLTTTRNMIKELRATTDKKKAEELYQIISSRIDKLAKRNIVHKNKASNNKSKLQKLVNSL
ncbi:MAG: small subunit ribosomal protein S20 [Sphingobacteriales bacterium]|jgi:small subunit ribosomal protein S20